MLLHRQAYLQKAKIWCSSLGTEDLTVPCLDKLGRTIESQRLQLRECGAWS